MWQRFSLFTASFALFALLAFAGAAPEKKPSEKPALKAAAPEGILGDLSGYYACRGKETSGKEYTGIVVIDKKVDVYAVYWHIGGGSFVGVGFRDGNTLSVGWAAKEGSRGVNVYQIQGKTLNGKWTAMPGTGKVATETLTFLKDLERVKEEKDDE